MEIDYKETYQRFLKNKTEKGINEFLKLIPEIEEMRNSTKIQALKGCRFLPGSKEKRFVNNLGKQMKITKKQTIWLNTIFFRYRKQHNKI